LVKNLIWNFDFLGSGERDLVLLRHEVGIEWPDNRKVRIVFKLWLLKEIAMAVVVGIETLHLHRSSGNTTYQFNRLR
jgi:hypothetical protein